jgi:hypothetical protein
MGSKYICSIHFGSKCTYLLLHFLFNKSKQDFQSKNVINKSKHEQTKAYEHIRRLGNMFQNAQQMSLQ